MSEEKIIFCGNNDKFLAAELTRFSDKSNGGPAFRIPSLIKCKNSLIAVCDRQTCASDWGYIELVMRKSDDGGETWSEIKVVAAPPARRTEFSDNCSGSAFYIDPCMAVNSDGKIILLADFFPESKGIHLKKMLDKKKEAYTFHDGSFCRVIYDRDGKFYIIDKSGEVLSSRKRQTGLRVDEPEGALYSQDEYLGNIYLNGKSPSKINEANVKTTFGAPLKAPKRSYVYMLTSDDCGETWSAPNDITPEILNKTDGTFLGMAPGIGVTTHQGRIVMPLYTEKNGSASIYSIDGGETWHRMAQHPYAQNTGEWQTVQAPGGALLGLGRQKRYGKTPLCVSYDDGRTWENAGKTNLYAPKCQKSVISIGNYVFCSHPSEKERENGVITVGKFTKQKGKTAGINWYTETQINSGFFAYSCLARIDELHIGVLYEAQPSSFICFKKFKIEDLI